MFPLPHHNQDSKAFLDRLISVIRQRLAFGQDYTQIEAELHSEEHINKSDVYLCYVAAKILNQSKNEDFSKYRHQES